MRRNARVHASNSRRATRAPGNKALTFISTALEKKHFPDGINNGIEAITPSSSVSKHDVDEGSLGNLVSPPDLLASSALSVADDSVNGTTLPAIGKSPEEAIPIVNEKRQSEGGAQGKIQSNLSQSENASSVPSQGNVPVDRGNGANDAVIEKGINTTSAGVKPNDPAIAENMTTLKKRNDAVQSIGMNKGRAGSGVGSRQSGAALMSLQSSAAETLDSMDFGNKAEDSSSNRQCGRGSSSLASSRWNKIRNFTRAVRAFSEPLRRDGQPWPKPIGVDDGGKKEGSIGSGGNRGMLEDSSRRSSINSAGGDSGGDGNNGAGGNHIEGTSQRIDEGLDDGGNPASALSLPELLGAPPTSNEAALRWRKLRTWAKVMKHFRSQVPTRRRSFDHKDLVASEMETAAATKAKAKAAAAFAGDIVMVAGSSATATLAQSNDLGALRNGNSTSTTEHKIAPMPLLPLGDLSNKAVNNNGNIDGKGVPRRRNSDPNVARAKDLTQTVLKQWMREGGQAERAKEKAAKDAANERTFRGLPWQCTVCAKKHFKTVAQMQSSRCVACGAGRDVVVGLLQRWREELKEGDWVHTKRYAGSGHYLGRIEAIEVADRDSLGIAEAQAKARALVPSVNVPTSFSGMMKAVISLSRSKRYKSVAKAATSYTPVGPRLNPKVAGIAVIAAGSGTGGSGANSAAGGGGGGGSSASGVLSGSATPLSARSGDGAGGNKALLTARSGDGGATSARSGDGGGGKSAELPSTPGRLPSTPGRLTSRSDGQTSASGTSVGGGDTTASKANKANKKRGGALVPWYEEVPHEPDFDFLPSADPFGPPAVLFSVATSTGEHLVVPRWWLQPPPHLPNLRPGNLDPFEPFSSSSAQFLTQLEPPSPLSPKSPWSRFSSEREPSSPGGGGGGGSSGWNHKQKGPPTPKSPLSPSRRQSSSGGGGPGKGASRRYSFAGFGNSGSGSGGLLGSANNSANGAMSMNSSRDSVDGSRDSFMSRDHNDFVAGDRVLVQRPRLIIKKTTGATADVNKDNSTIENGDSSVVGGDVASSSIAESDIGGDIDGGSNDGSEGSGVGALALALPSDIATGRAHDEAVAAAAAADLNTSWNKAAVHAVAADGTLLLRHAPSGALQRGVFPELCAPDAGDARKLPKPLLWKHPCGGCGRRRNLKEDAVCVACGKSKNFAFSDRAHAHLKRVHKLERLVVKPKPPARPTTREEPLSAAASMASGSSSRRPSLAAVERRPSLAFGDNGSNAISAAGSVNSSSTSSSNWHLPGAASLSPRQKEPSSPLMGADASSTERLQPTGPRRLSMRRGSMRRNSMSRQSSGLDTLGEVAAEER